MIALNRNAQTKPTTRPAVRSVSGRRQPSLALSRRPSAAAITAGSTK
jgi:hypothetical protein